MDASGSGSGPRGPRERQRADGMSALRQRLPGQRTPPDPSVEQPNAADLTYGWHHHSSSSSDSSNALGHERAEEIELSSDESDFIDADQDVDDHDDAQERRRPAANPWNVSDTRAGVATTSTPQWPFATWWSDGRGAASSNTAAAGTSFDGGTYGYPPPANDDPTTAPQNPEDSFICRICFDGPGSIGDQGESLGKLIAPCKCRGTMKFVHQRCLTRWRATSRRSSSVMQCDQCGAPYRFRKSRFVGLATNRILLMLVSCYLFISIVWIVGFAAETTMRIVEEPKADAHSSTSHGTGWWPFRRQSASSTSSSPSTGTRIYQSINLDRNSGAYYDDDDDGYYSYRYDYRYIYSEPAAYLTLIKAAVKYVGSGEAFQHLFANIDEATPDVTGGLDVATDEEVDDKGWWTALKDNWKYGKGGIWEGQRPTDSSAGSPQDASSLPQPDQNGEGVGDGQERGSGRTDRNPPLPDKEAQPKAAQTHRERYDAINAQFLGKDERPTRPVTRKKPNKEQSHRNDERATKTPGWLERLMLQFSLGASLVGISSFLSLLLGISTWGPFHLNLGLGRGFARLARRRARGGGGGGGGGSSEGEALVAVFLLFLVIVGIIRALFAVYGFTTYLSKRLLTRVEDIILDWGGEDKEEEEQQQQQQEGQQDTARPEPPIVRVPRWRAWQTRFLRRRRGNEAVNQ